MLTPKLHLTATRTYKLPQCFEFPVSKLIVIWDENISKVPCTGVLVTKLPSLKKIYIKKRKEKGAATIHPIKRCSKGWLPVQRGWSRGYPYVFNGCGHAAALACSKGMVTQPFPYIRGWPCTCFERRLHSHSPT